MKNIKYITLLFAALFVAACGDPDLRFEPFDDATKGAFARNLSLSGAFDLGNIAGSSFEGTVEFYDENNGANVASYNWTVEFRSNGGNGGVDVAATTFLNIPASSFTTNADGLPEVSFTLGFQDALDALGVDALSLVAGDVFRFDATVTKTDGSSFGPNNTGPNVISQAPFAGLFRINASVVCLFADSFLIGNYTITNGPVAGVWGSVYGVDGTVVTLAAGSGATERVFTTPYGPEALGSGFPMTQTLNFVCDAVIAVDSNLGASCGGAGIAVGQGSSDPGTFDLFDDSSFTINVTDDINSDCAAAIADVSMTFTKN